MQSLGPAFPAVPGNDLLGDVVGIVQLGVCCPDELPGGGIVLYHRHDAVPVVGIDAAHGLTPEVGIFVERQFGIHLAEVEMKLTLIGKAVGRSVPGLEMPYPAFLAMVLLCRLQYAAVLSVVGMDGNAHLRQMVNQSAAGLTVGSRETTGGGDGGFLRLYQAVSERVDAFQKVPEYLVCHLLLTGVMDMQEIGDISPKPVKGFGYGVKDGLSVLLLPSPDFLRQPFMAALAAVVGKDFLGDVVLVMQMAVALPDLLP